MIRLYGVSIVSRLICPPIQNSLLLWSAAWYCLGSWLDYCNAVLYGAPVSSIRKLQRIRNIAARIVTQSLRKAHALPLLEQLHWLPVRHRIESSWPYWHSRSLVHQPKHTSPATSDRVKFHAVFVPLTRLYCINLSPELTLLTMLSVVAYCSYSLEFS